MKILVAYFSAEKGRTAAVAHEIAEYLKADPFRIEPEEPYSRWDLWWINPFARCNREKFFRKEVPIEKRVENFSDYDVVFLGFPIWYGCAPNVVTTFCRCHDWEGKKVFLFATSRGSGIGRSVAMLESYMWHAKIVGAMLVKHPKEVANWLDKVL